MRKENLTEDNLKDKANEENVLNKDIIDDKESFSNWLKNNNEKK